MHNKAMLLAVLFALIAANTMPPPAISADNNKARIAKMKVSDIKTMSDFKEKVYQEMIPDIDNPENANRLAQRIEKSTGVMKELWMATLDLCRRQPKIAEAKYMKYLPELVKQLPEVRQKNDPLLNAEIHNLRVLWTTSELLTGNYKAAQGIFEQLDREDKDKCESLKKQYLAINGKDSTKLSLRQDIGKQLRRHYKYRYVDTTGLELSLVGQMLNKQCKQDPALLAVLEKNRGALKHLGDFDYVGRAGDFHM